MAYCCLHRENFADQLFIQHVLWRALFDKLTVMHDSDFVAKGGRLIEVMQGNDDAGA